MARIARIVVPEHPHHIIQRGNRCQQVFFSDDDKQYYSELLQKHAIKSDIEIWAYCFMDNHVHFMAVPKGEKSFARGIGAVHRHYSRMVNFREGWRGYLWQGRFISYPLDERYLYAAIRYVERNPVRAGVVEKPEDYRWSSAKAHVFGTQDKLLSDNFLVSEIEDWASYLLVGDSEEEMGRFRQHARTGRPLGNEKFLIDLEVKTGRTLRKSKPGPKKNNN